MKEFKNIFMAQIQLIERKSKEMATRGEPLELNDLRKLEALTKAWRSYQGTEIDLTDETLKELSSEELRQVLDRIGINGEQL